MTKEEFWQMLGGSDLACCSGCPVGECKASAEFNTCAERLRHFYETEVKEDEDRQA